jgi:hypothetical protein
MKRTATLLMVALSFVSIAIHAQTDNPRGIYKMTKLTGHSGEIEAPLEQYKICTDDITLTVSSWGATFGIVDNDHQVFNYTGDQPKAKNDKSALIYDSNDKHFTLKWWSTFANHAYFPKDDWCIEKYESGLYTERSKPFFDALTGTAEVDKKNPLTGTWRFIGHVDELSDVKKELPKLQENYPASKYFNRFFVFTADTWTVVFKNGGAVNKVEYDKKRSFTVGDKFYFVKWLSKNRVAVEDRVDYHADWMILERVTDGSAPLSHILGQFGSVKK